MRCARACVRFCPDEHQARGKSCVVLGRNFLERIALCINNGLVTIAHQFSQYEEQLTEVNAAYSVLKDWPMWKPAKDFVPPNAPGSESVYANRRAVDQLGHTEATVFQLCSALNEDITIQVCSICGCTERTHFSLFIALFFVFSCLTLSLYLSGFSRIY